MLCAVCCALRCKTQQLTVFMCNVKMRQPAPSWPALASAPTRLACATKPPPHPWGRCGFVSTCRQLLQHFVETHFPTNKALEDRAAGSAGTAGAAEEDWYDGGDGSEFTWRAASEDASAGQQQPLQAGQKGGEEDPTSAELKAAMLERIAALDLPPNFLDEVRDPASSLSICVITWCVHT